MKGVNSKKTIKWMSIPYLPISPKYIVLMVVLFLVAVSGTSLSKFEACAISVVAYSTAILLDRAEDVLKFSISLVNLGTQDE